MSDHMLLLPFDTAEPEFARGFEMGRLWALCRETDDELVETVHAANAEMVMRIAEASGRSFASVDLDDTFVEVTLGGRVA